MIQRNLKMRAVEPEPQMPEEDHHAALADRYYLENAYLPPTDDQSWRERAALGIAPGQDSDGDFEDENMDFAPRAEDVEPEVPGQGRGGLLVALTLAAILVPGIVSLTFPATLTAGFWRARQTTVPQAQSPVAGVPKITAPFHASLQDQTPRPSPMAAPPAEPDTQSQPPAPAEPGSVASPAANPVAKDKASVTRARGNTGNDDGGGFYAKVMGPDGRLHARYFPSAAAPDTPRAAVPPEAGGFYAMVAEPDGTLRYRHFSSKPAQ